MLARTEVGVEWKRTNVGDRNGRLSQVNIQNGMIDGYGDVQAGLELYWVPAKANRLYVNFPQFSELG